jgi:hypothetical protein
MIVVEIKGTNPKDTREVVGVYRAPNEDMRAIERLVARTSFVGTSTKRSIIGGDLNLPYADWNGNAGGNSVTQAFINCLVWENGYSQVIDSQTRGDALLDVYLVRPDSSVNSSSIVQGVSDHHGVTLEVEWEKKVSEPQVERTVPVYNKTDVVGLLTFLRDKLVGWASKGSSGEEIWVNVNNIVYESIELFVSHKILRKTRTPNITRRLND